MGEGRYKVKNEIRKSGIIYSAMTWSTRQSAPGP